MAIPWLCEVVWCQFTNTDVSIVTPDSSNLCAPPVPKSSVQSVRAGVCAESPRSSACPVRTRVAAQVQGNRIVHLVEPPVVPDADNLQTFLGTKLFHIIRQYYTCSLREAKNLGDLYICHSKRTILHVSHKTFFTESAIHALAPSIAPRHVAGPLLSKALL